MRDEKTQPLIDQQGFVPGLLIGACVGIAVAVSAGRPLLEERSRLERELRNNHVRLEEARELCRIKRTRFDL